MNNAEKFFEEVIRTEEAKAIIASLEKPESEEEALKLYSEIAEKLGMELSAEEIREYLDAKKASGEVDDEELSQLSGGGENADCKDTYKQRENCWWEDGCDRIFNSYDDYLCNGSYYMLWYGKRERRCTSNYFSEKYCTLNYVSEP